MPIRKIPKNYLVVTGRFASAKNDESHEFESLLERDHLILLEFDNEVASFEVQPVRIPVPGVPQTKSQLIPADSKETGDPRKRAVIPS